jgi:hypothetical protein
MSFTTEELLKSHLSMVTSEIEEKKADVISQLNHLVDSINHLKKDVKDDFFQSLGGQIQNVWSLYHKLGQLSRLSDHQASLRCVLSPPDFKNVKGK